MDWLWNIQVPWNMKFIIKATKQFKPIKNIKNIPKNNEF